VFNTGELFLRAIVDNSENSEIGDSIQSLRDLFKDPNSPFYLAPGTQGPSSPGAELEAPAEAVSPTDPYEHDPHLNPAKAEHARQIALANGYDPLSFWEQPLVWASNQFSACVYSPHIIIRGI
jgi:hypothetical protein